jgi:hypothetical protein
VPPPAARAPRSPREVGEDLEQGDHGGILDVEEVLVERVRAGHVGRQPQALPIGLAELLAGGVGEQRRRQRVHGGPLHPVDEVHAGGEIAPLVVAAGLQRAAVLPVEVQVVQRLQSW